LADAWQACQFPGDGLVDSFGRRFRVIFPGRRWGGPGPDFQGAVLALDSGQLLHGDIEVHRRASGWQAHRHAEDPAYARVILHVVQRADAITLDGQGRRIPTLEFQPAPAHGPPRVPVVPCVRDAAAVRAVVEAAGRERFRAKAARFEGDLVSGLEPDQVVWRGVAEALGYSRNRRPFGELAEAVPWLEARHVVRERGPLGLAGLLLGTAGLLGEASLAEAHAWRAVQRMRGARAMLSLASWDRRQLRAGNAPAQRCRGLAELAARWAGRRVAGPAEDVLEAVQAAAHRQRVPLWPRVYAAPWIGRGRAQVIVVNVLLPFAAAAGLAEAEALFTRLPGEPPNRIVRYMASQLATPELRFRLACQQQGLVQLFHTTCAARACDVCPARGMPIHWEVP
jgi:hypothetical protein